LAHYNGLKKDIGRCLSYRKAPIKEIDSPIYRYLSQNYAKTWSNPLCLGIIATI